MDRYGRSARYWDEVFSREEPRFPTQRGTGCAALDAALDWLADGAGTAVDFGCGNGALLFLCSQRGTSDHIGIDLSHEAIRAAREGALQAPAGAFRFLEGGVEALGALADHSADAVILSNILDNLWPEDARRVLAEVRRAARPGARVLVKLNPYLSAEQIRAWGVRVIAGNLLDDGLPLWNRPTGEWSAELAKGFLLERHEEAYWPELDRRERLFLLRRV